jgi:hypothetical protein
MRNRTYVYMNLNQKKLQCYKHTSLFWCSVGDGGKKSFGENRHLEVGCIRCGIARCTRLLELWHAGVR